MDKRFQYITFAISQLLYKHDCVIVPGWGGFVKEYKPASFDYVQGKIIPPSSSVSFNENLVTDDGLLVDFLQSTSGKTLSKIQGEIHQFKDECKGTLSKKEVISIPQVGRILKDFENKTQFIPETNNFNTDTFGLPVIHFYPIHREFQADIPRVSKETPVVIQARPKPIPLLEKKTSFSKRMRVALPLLLLLVFIPFLVMTFLKSGWDSSNPARLPVSDKNLNVSPTEDYYANEDEDLSDTMDEDIDYSLQEEALGNARESLEELEAVEEEDEPTIVAEEAASELKEKEEAPLEPVQEEEDYQIIYVGVYRYQDGVNQTVAQIIENDFTPYTYTLSNGKTKVGVKVFSYDNASEILPKVKAGIAKDAYLAK